MWVHHKADYWRSSLVVLALEVTMDEPRNSGQRAVVLAPSFAAADGSYNFFNNAPKLVFTASVHASGCRSRS